MLCHFRETYRLPYLVELSAARFFLFFPGKSIIFPIFPIDAPMRQGNEHGHAIAESAIVTMHCERHYETHDITS